MDALNKVLGGGKTAGTNEATTANNNTESGLGAGSSSTTTNTQKDDFGDKGAAYVNKEYLGGKLSHDQLEKVTDAGREQFEKATGYDIPDKASN